MIGPARRSRAADRWTASTRRASAAIRASSSRSVFSPRDSKRLGASADAAAGGRCGGRSHRAFRRRPEAPPVPRRDRLGCVRSSARPIRMRARRAIPCVPRGFRAWRSRPRAIRRRAAPRLGSERRLSDLRRSFAARTRAQAFVRPVLAARKARNAFADRIEPVVAFEFVGFDALLGRFVGDDFVEPIAQAHAGASGCLPRRTRASPALRLVTFQAAALFMVATVAEVVPIEAPSANHGATVGCFCARGEKTVKIASQLVARGAAGETFGLYCRDKTTTSCILRQMRHIRSRQRRARGRLVLATQGR